MLLVVWAAAVTGWAIIHAIRELYHEVLNFSDKCKCDTLEEVST